MICFGPIWLKISPRTPPSCRSRRDLQNSYIILSNGAMAIYFTPNSSTKCKATCKKSTGYHPNPMKNLRNPQRSTHHLFPDAPPPLPPPTRPHLLQAKAAKERADAAAVEKEAAEKAAAEAIVYIKCPHCRHLCYIFWRMSGWALIIACVAGIKISSIGRFSTIPCME